MLEHFQSPSEASFWLMHGRLLFQLIPLIGTACFCYIVAKRLQPLIRAEKDFRFDRPFARLAKVLQFWLGQWKHPRYRLAGSIHILIFAGFIILATRAFSLLILGVNENFVMPGLSGRAGQLYDVIRDYAATVVFFAVIFAAIRRGVFKPARYAAPPQFGKWRSADAIFLLILIAILMAADGLFESSRAIANLQLGHPLEPLNKGSLSWLFSVPLTSASLLALQRIHLSAYLTHELTFFFLLCYRPFGVQFHVETSLFAIYFAKLNPGTLKPVRWGIAPERLDQVKSFGVKTFEDFTWKHMLDFYSCADCGRCSDQCPANAVGRPLSPKLLTLKARDYSFRHYPVLGNSNNGNPLVGAIYSEDEIWSCTTCGACEAECPILVEYIDKIVDLRRGLVDSGNVPQSLQKPMRALESRGNPFGKLEKKRADWANDKEFQKTCKVRILDSSSPAGTLYFVDSVTAYNDRIQAIGRATARVLDHARADFGILGAAEKDSGHEVRRFGEEMLFMTLRDHNVEAIRESGAERIVTSDPHAFNALRKEYGEIPPVEHMSQWMARQIAAGKIKFAPAENGNNVYAYHDPCYLGRHNGVYDAPRDVLDAIPGMKRVEMRRSKDRSFCCGGGGISLFYEPKEDERMGVVRVRMAADAGANVIVTACPYCMLNVEDAIKVAGLEGKMTAVDLTELVDQHIVREV